MSNKQLSLALLAEKFPSEQPPLWNAICNSVHTDPDEQKAVARAVVKDILSSKAPKYANAFYSQALELYPEHPFAAYSITEIFPALPTFAKRASKRREKTILAWAYRFLQEAGEQALLDAFEARILSSLNA